MGVWDDYFNNQNGVRGKVSNAVSNIGNGNADTSLYPTNSLINAAIDEQWGGLYTGQSTNNYYDYYFSGQDIRVTIDGTEDDPQFSDLPIADFSWRIDQNKQTLFGFWSYCVDEETEALTVRGWVKGNDLNEDDIILSMKPDGQLAWSTIRGIYRSHFKGLMHRVTSNNIDALVTPGHKFALADGTLKPIDEICMKDRIRTMGEAIEDVGSTRTDAFVELVGWYITEGHDRKDVSAIEIAQSQKVNPFKVEQIKTCLKLLGVKYSSWVKKSSGVEKIYIGSKQSIVRELKSVAPDKVPTYEFIVSLSKYQRELLLKTMIDGDGYKIGNGYGYIQKDPKQVDVVTALCAMLGIPTSIIKRSHDDCLVVSMKLRKFNQGYGLNFHGGKSDGRTNKNHQPTQLYDGIVWCPQTEYGTFVCRRNNKVYVTGNTMDAVMRGTRVVSGSFTIMTRSPNYMKQALAKAAQSRQANLGSKNYSYYRNLTEDDANIATYWGKNMDPSLQNGQLTNMFSVHPPFSLVILYGIQNVSLSDSATRLPASQDVAGWRSDNVLYADTNERLIEADNVDQSMRIILDDCELTSMQSGYNNSGQVVCEQYEFFARDMVIPDPPS